MPSKLEDDEPRKRIRIQRRRLGRIVSFQDEKKFGFIEAEDFHDDVFFHIQDWEGKTTREGKATVIAPEVGVWVEFELDDDHREAENRLRAKVVRPTNRPSGQKLSGRDATFNIVTHHRNARRKRPTWRK